MKFASILSVSFLAVLASASPAPVPQISVDQGQINQLASDVQSFSNNVGNQFSSLSSSWASVRAGWSGQATEAIDDAFNQLGSAVNEVRQTSDQIASGLSSATSTFQEAEDANAGRFGGI